MIGEPAAFGRVSTDFADADAPIVFDDGRRVPAASLLARLLAHGVDSSITALLAAVVAVVYGRESLFGADAYLPVGVVMFPFVWATADCVYHGVCEARFGGTLGKRALGLRLVEQESGARLSTRVAWIRAALPLAVFAAPFVGVVALGMVALPALVLVLSVLALAGPLVLMAPWAMALGVKLSYLRGAGEATGQGWHDRRAHTVVIADRPRR